MLESLVKPEVLEHRSYEMFFMAIAIGAVSITMAAMISHGEEVSHLAVAFACIATAPVMVKIIQLEERKDEVIKAGPFFGGYWAIIKTYTFYFLGIIVIFSLIFALLPEEKSTQLFSAQVKELKAIRSLGSGRATRSCGFLCILENNLGVLALALIFSFIFGAGAIYIITWNASIIGVLIGAAAKEGIGISIGIPGAIPMACRPVLDSVLGVTGVNVLASYLMALPCSILALVPHGIFEISAYFMAGLVGGILSTISVNNRLPDKEVVLHTVILLAIAIVFIFIGAAIEAGL